jgi:hypothetical protein
MSQLTAVILDNARPANLANIHSTPLRPHRSNVDSGVERANLFLTLLHLLSLGCVLCRFLSQTSATSTLSLRPPFRLQLKMRSTSLIATASALLLGFPLASATPASLHSRSPTPKAATPISIPLYRRAPRVKRDGAAGFLKKAQRLKQKYGGSTARSGRWSRRDGSVSMTSYEDS